MNTFWYIVKYSAVLSDGVESHDRKLEVGIPKISEKMAYDRAYNLLSRIFGGNFKIEKVTIKDARKHFCSLHDYGRRCICENCQKKLNDIRDKKRRSSFFHGYQYNNRRWPIDGNKWD